VAFIAPIILLELVGLLLFPIAFLLRPLRRYVFIAYAAPLSALIVLALVRTLLLDYACVPAVVGGPFGEQSFSDCSTTWPKIAVYPIWIGCTLIAWWQIYLAQRRLNRIHSFFGRENLPEEPSDITTLKLYILLAGCPILAAASSRQRWDRT
jgi:hypothetical protein